MNYQLMVHGNLLASFSHTEHRRVWQTRFDFNFIYGPLYPNALGNVVQFSHLR